MDLELNYWTDVALKDQEFDGLDWFISKTVWDQPWYDWIKEYDLELFFNSHYSCETDIRTYRIMTKMPTELETYWLLTWGYACIKK